MEPLKTCNLCGCSSNETAIFSCSYAKGDLQICLECLTEGIMEINKNNKTKDIPISQPLNIEGLDLNIPNEVYGFSCENCGNVIFSELFPVICDCGHVNNDNIVQKQGILNRKK